MPVTVTRDGALVGGSSSLPPSSVPLSLWDGSSLPLIDGRVVSYRRVYREQPYVAAAINLLCRQVARLPLKTYVRAADGTREPDRDHAVAQLLRSPGERRSALQLKHGIMLGLLVEGNAVFRKTRGASGAFPTGLRPLSWHSLTPIFDDERIEVIAWRHHVRHGAPEILDVDDVVHFRWEGPDTPIGISPLSQLRTTVALEEAAQTYAAAMLRNGGRVGVAVVLEGNARFDEDTTRLMHNEFRGRHGGPENANREVVLGGGVKEVTAIGGQSAVDVEMIEGRKVSREETLAMIGVPPALLGILEATFSNNAQQHEMLYDTVLGPWLSNVDSTLQVELVEREPAWATDGVYVEFDVSEKLKGDPAKRFAAYKNGQAAGALTVNDVRDRENLPRFDIPAADEPLVMASQIQPLSSLDSSAPPAPASPADDPGEVPA